GPEMPMRTAPPVSGNNASMSFSASSRCSDRVDSTRVIARASARRSPSRKPSINGPVATTSSIRGERRFAQRGFLLACPHGGINAAKEQQFRVVSALDDAPGVEYQDLVGIDDRR